MAPRREQHLIYTWENRHLSDGSSVLFEARDQGLYETCTYFAQVASIEARCRILEDAMEPNVRLGNRRLSVQHAIELCPYTVHQHNGFVEAPTHEDLVLAIKQNGGLVLEHNLPYLGGPQGLDTVDKYWSKFGAISGFRLIHPDNTQQVSDHIRRGPVVAYYKVHERQCDDGSRMIRKNQGKTIKDKDGSDLSHSILLYGYGIERPTNAPYAKFQNSEAMEGMGREQ